MRTAWAAVPASVLVAFFLARGLIGDSSPTYDEPVHLGAGYTALTAGDYRLNAMDHPPLGEMWAAVPLLFSRPDRFLSDPAWLEARAYHFGDLFLYHNRLPSGAILGAARTWNLITLTLLAAAALVSWAWRLGGAPAAWGAAAALAFCVPWFSNAALITTDASAAALFFAACAVLAAAKRSLGTWLLAGAAVGAALAAKFNMILLPPLIGLTLALERRAERVRPIELLVAAAAAACVVAAAYRWGGGGLYFQGLAATLSRLSEGRGSYLLGMHSVSGWWWYFPVAVLVKTPLPLLLVGGYGARLAWRRSREEAVWLLLPPLGYLAAAMTSRTQIGYRHLLPVYPFLCMWAGLGAAALWRRGAAARGLLAAAAAWLSISVLAGYPNYLSYFNEIARGRGEQWLSDSNLDWGQDLPALSRALIARGNPPVVLSYFGSGDPGAYGIGYIPLAIVSNVERPGNATLAPKGPVLLAISQTNLVGTYYRDQNLFSWLRSRRPAAAPGGSIFLYDLTADGDGRARLAAMLAVLGRREDARLISRR